VRGAVCQHVDEELPDVFLATTGIREAKTVGGICGAARHPPIGRWKNTSRCCKIRALRSDGRPCMLPVNAQAGSMAAWKVRGH